MSLLNSEAKARKNKKYHVLTLWNNYQVTKILLFKEMTCIIS